MRRRYTLVLNIEDHYYKFLSVFFSSRDASYFVYTHLKDESSPLRVMETLSLLRTTGRLTSNSTTRTISDQGNHTHISIHPNRIYLKKRAEDGKEQHLLEEVEPQPYNVNNYRLHLILTPAPVSHLPVLDSLSKKKDEELGVFDWESEQCPQVSLYELNENFEIAQIDSLLPAALDYKLIASDGVHPSIILHLKATTGQQGIWMPRSGIFGRVISRGAISKSKLQDIIKHNGLHYDVSSIPDDAVITDFKMLDPDSDDQRLVVTW